MGPRMVVARKDSLLFSDTKVVLQGGSKDGSPCCRRFNMRGSNVLENVIEGKRTTKGSRYERLFLQDIESFAVKNREFRRALYTTRHCQFVVMALEPDEEIGAEVHMLDQFFRVEEGTGVAVLDGVRTTIRAEFAVAIPAGANHNIINTGGVPLKLYTLYAPPNHRDGVVHHTRADAEADTEYFDGRTTEFEPR